MQENQRIDEILSTRLDGTKETVGDALNIAIKGLEQMRRVLESARKLVTSKIKKEDFQDVDIYELFIKDIIPFSLISLINYLSRK